MGETKMRSFDVIAISLCAMIISYVGVGLIRRWAPGRMLDIPNHRSSHTWPMLQGGGMAIVAVILVGGSLSLFYAHTEGAARRWIFCSLGALLVAGVSLLDDLKPISKQARFASQSVAAVFAMLGLGVWRQVGLPGFGTLDLGWLGWPITFLWIVGLTNAYNFMDGIDGIAGGQGIVASAGWGIIGLITGNAFLTVLGFLLAASCLGFLFHNWPPARIFMGDVGSAFLGYTFAVLVVSFSHRDARLAFIGILFIWPFVFDTFFTFFRRLRNLENVFEAHRSHLYQRLVISGYSHGVVSTLYICLALVGGLLGIAWYCNLPGSGPAIWVVIPACCFGLCGGVELTERKRQNPV